MSEEGGYYKGFERPAKVITLAKAKKRALIHRLCDESPKKKVKSTPVKRKRPFGAQPPPPDDVTNEDSSLLDLFRPKTLSSSPSSLSSSSPSFLGENGNSLFGAATKKAAAPTTVNTTLSYLDFIETPPSVVTVPVKKRQQLTPVPASPSGKTSCFQLGGARAPLRKARTNLFDKFSDEADSVLGLASTQSPTPCLDWSLKTKLTVISGKPFGFNCSSLKSSEESSGTSAFARCIDIDPDGIERKSESSPVGSQLDTSLGAQFHKCCLYWQHPSLPGMTLFPRENGNLSFSGVTGGTTNAGTHGGIRMEQKILDVMLLDWVDAFRSLFHLLRTRQCPYFYVSTNSFTCLFSAAGTQGLDFLQVYLTPSSKGLRDSLTQEGIEFTTPCSTNVPIAEEKIFKRYDKTNGESDDEEPGKWLDEMGISQDVSLSKHKTSPTVTAEEKSKSNLLVIAGTNTLAFFNFLINSKNLLISPTGTFAGIPPTILSPVAFHGATLQRLKVKQTRSNKSTAGDVTYCIEMTGPVLPHVTHMLCPVLKKTVENFKIRMSLLQSTVNLNLNSGSDLTTTLKANAFEMQNLSDCGLSKSILEVFCRPNNMDTISNFIECKNGLYHWC